MESDEVVPEGFVAGADSNDSKSIDSKSVEFDDGDCGINDAWTPGLLWFVFDNGANDAEMSNRSKSSRMLLVLLADVCVGVPVLDDAFEEACNINLYMYIMSHYCASSLQKKIMKSRNI